MKHSRERKQLRKGADGKRRMLLLGMLLFVSLPVNGCADRSTVTETEASVLTEPEEKTGSAEKKEAAEETETGKLEDGVYTAEFQTDNAMFRVNEVYGDQGTLTIEDGKMTIHVTLGSKNIVNLYAGTAKEAEKEGAELLFPTVDEVVYPDGWSEEVYGYDIPVPALSEEFDVALLGKKGKWYDHKVMVCNIEPLQKENGLVFEKSMELKYAENFRADYYQGGFVILTTTADGKKFLIVPEGKEVPEGLDKELEEGMCVLHRPIKNIYLSASAVMDMFWQLDCLDAAAFSSQKAEDWYIEEAKKATEEGSLLYAGKYDKPDYEMLVSKNCSLALENRMISHAPEVMEKLEEFGIPVMIEYSSLEMHPLGRMEWIKFFGALFGKEEEAEKIFKEQDMAAEKIAAGEKNGLSTAFFFFTSDGLVQVRKSSDYIPKMIEMAGGTYIFQDLGESEAKRSTVNMQIEEFYDKAKDADILIYNSSIDGGVGSAQELLAQCPVLADFKAVKNGNLWCTANDVYQRSMSIVDLIEEMNQLFCGGDETELSYFFRLK